jgi:hypothetical protein
MLKIIIILTLISASLFAGEAKVLSLRGFISYQGKTVKKDTVLSQNGKIKTGIGSYIKLQLTELNAIIIVGPNSEMDLKLDENDKTKNATLLQGLARWVSDKKKSDAKRAIRTRQAVMGIRGTDFILKASSLFGETEIIVLEGKVNFASELEKSDQKELTKNQWGGIGGRFGGKIGDILDLPPSIISYFNDIIPKT